MLDPTAKEPSELIGADDWPEWDIPFEKRSPVTFIPEA
jgi:hypothetical protein